VLLVILRLLLAAEGLAKTRGPVVCDWPDRYGGTGDRGYGFGADGEICRRPFRAWGKSPSSTRGRRAFGASTPGYMPLPLRGKARRPRMWGRFLRFGSAAIICGSPADIYGRGFW